MAVLLDIKASLLKYCNDFIISQGATATVINFDFDAHATQEQWPDKDLVGIAELGVSNHTDHYVTTLMIGVCTRSDDKELQRLSPLIAELFDKLKPGDMEVKIVDYQTGMIKGGLVVMDHVNLMPVGRTNTRPVQFIAVQLASSFLSPP